MRPPGLVGGVLTELIEERARPSQIGEQKGDDLRPQAAPLPQEFVVTR